MYLEVAVVLLAVLGLVNLALVLSVIRHLRRQTAAPPQFGPPRLSAGQQVPQISAVTTAGEERALADLLGSLSLRVSLADWRTLPCAGGGVHPPREDPAGRDPARAGGDRR